MQLGARCHRRRRRRGCVPAWRAARVRIVDGLRVDRLMTTIPHRLHRAQPRRAQADDDSHGGRHGARRVRVRHGADARRRARERRWWRPASRTTSSSSAAARRPKCKAASTALPPAIVEVLARHRRPERRAASSSRRSRWCSSTCPKRDSGKPSNVVIRGATPAGLALRPQVKIVAGTDVPARHVGDHRGPVDRRRISRRRPRRDAALRASATGPSSACSTPAAPGFNSEIWGDAEQLLQAFRRVSLLRR